MSALVNRPARILACILLCATAPGAVHAQGIEQGATETGEQTQQGDRELNQYGWPTDYEAQVGAGTTNGVTTGFSGPQEGGGGEGEVSLPPLPSADLCANWQETEAHSACMQKVVQQNASQGEETDGG